MEQNRLKEYEARCVEEEPPFCQAACPLRVDGREVCRRLGGGDADGALAALLRALPLPRLLTRLCEEPCKAACKRGALGGSVELRAIERFCVLNGAAPRAPLIPPGGKRILIVGSGLSGLTAAWDLARKGHAVTLRHAGPIGASLLPAADPEDLAAETEALLRARVRAVPLERPAAELLDELLRDFDAACVALDDPALGPGLSERLGPIDPETLASALPHVFAAGAASSFVDRAAQGRAAAQSVLRDLQGASLTAGRERGGTRLHVNLQGIPSVPTTLTEAEREGETSSPEAARSEAERCLDCRCMECVKACTYLRAYGSYPKRYAREIYNNLSVVQGTRSANRMINSCSRCGLCASVCPKGFDVGELCAEARDEMNRQGRMPPSAHEFALLDMEHADGPHAALFRPEGGRVLFPGCQLAASDPERTAALYGFLRENAEGGLGLWLGCCGAPALWAGRTEAFARKLSAMEERWRGAGEPELVLACSACLQTFRRHAPGVRAVSVWEVLEELGGRGVALPRASGAAPESNAFVLYPPCTLLGEPELRDRLRRLAGGLGAELRPGSAGEECCGYGGLQACANPALADATAARIAEGAGGETLLVGCAMCRDRFASVGAGTAHLLDLMFPGRRGPGSPPPRLSERRENRERLRRELLRAVWGEAEGEEGAAMELRFEEGVRERLDKRRILDEDVRRVVLHAEATGRRMRSPEGRSLACLRPRNVTTWVEYTLEGEAARIHNAWTHRMVVRGADFGGDGA